MSGPKRVSTDGGDGLGQNPFADLDKLKLPVGDGAAVPPVSSAANKSPADRGAQKNRGRVDIIREKAGRGGKTVTVVTGFVGIGLPEKEQLAKKMQKACGVGGTVKEGRIEIQGDKREEIARILREAGFHPVFAGG